MDHLLLFQMSMAREWSIEVAESCPKEIATIHLDEFNNTIHWQVGHILTVAERMLFNFPSESTFLPDSFTGLFESGTSPIDGDERLPEFEELIVYLKEQQTRLLRIAPEQFVQRLVKPLFGFTTYGQCAGFVVLHETLHVGKMEEMMRVARQR